MQERISFCIVTVLYNSHKQNPFSYVKFLKVEDGAYAKIYCRICFYSCNCVSYPKMGKIFKQIKKLVTRRKVRLSRRFWSFFTTLIYMKSQHINY